MCKGGGCQRHWGSAVGISSASWKIRCKAFRTSLAFGLYVSGAARKAITVDKAGAGEVRSGQQEGVLVGQEREVRRDCGRLEGCGGCGKRHVTNASLRPIHRQLVEHCLAEFDGPLAEVDLAAPPL